MPRYQLLDQVRFFAIILVVLGHCIQFNIENNFDNIFFRIIYSFHMPLFFFISGFVSYNSITSGNPKILKKSLVLVYPFILWSFLWFLYAYDSSVLLNKFILLFKNPDSGFWFLWVLFWINVLLGLIYKVKNKYLMIILVLIIFLLPIKGYGLSSIKYHGIYFFMGMMVFKYKDFLLNIKVSNKMKIILVIVGLIFSTFYFPDIKEYYNIVGYGFISKIFVFGLKVTIATSMIIASFIIIDYLFKKDFFLKNYFVKIGTFYTLQIYLVHSFFKSTIHLGVPILDVLVNFILALSISLIFIKLLEIKQLSILNLILFGKK